jgi:RNA polymerase sigma-70 factor (ECF subfamily)
VARSPIAVADDPTSLSLLERVWQRDEESWDRLLYLYAPLVQHWCLCWGVQGPDAEDLGQEAFQAVAQSLQSFRRDRPGDTFRGWLRTITRRKVLDLLRRQKKQPEAEGGTEVLRKLHQVPDPAAGEEDALEQVRLLHHRALEMVRGQFEVRTWQAFWRCAVEGDSPVDVAADMGMTPAAVRQAKSRVLRRLKEELGELLG